MSFSASTWISSVFCLGLGILIGIQFDPPPLSDEALPTTHNMVPMHEADARHLQAWSEQCEVSLTRAVKDEITQQFQSFVANGLKTPVVEPDLSNAASSPRVEKQNEAFAKASSLMDDAIAVGELDVESARTLVDYLNSLPIDQQTALRAKQIDAFNRGLISSPLSPEEILTQGM